MAPETIRAIDIKPRFLADTLFPNVRFWPVSDHAWPTPLGAHLRISADGRFTTQRGLSGFLTVTSATVP